MLDDKLILAALDHANDGITITDMTQKDSPLIFINKAFEEISGYTKEEVIGKNCRFLQGNDTDRETIQDISTYIKNHQKCQVMIKNYRKNGMPFWNELSLSPIFDDNNKLTYYIGIQKDISSIISYQNKLQELSSYDNLTNLYNTRAFLHTTQAIIDSLTRKKQHCALGYIDINDFKFINDTHGHHYGDKILKLFADALKTSFRNSDIIARLGGDEFIIFGLVENQDNKWLEQRVKLALAKVNDQLDIEHQVSASTGLVIKLSTDILDLEECIAVADSNMYQNKSSNSQKSKNSGNTGNSGKCA